MSPISPIRLPSLPDASSVSGANSAGGNFQNVLQSAIQNVETASASADAAVQNYLAGGNQELHSTILATESASLDFEMFLQVRNKVVSAYEEVMRMQV